jgi:uncharacterized protein
VILSHGPYAALILTLAYLIRGVTGFGSGLIAVPLLALMFPLTLVVPAILLLDFSASFLLGGLNFNRVQWDEVKPLVPLGAVGVALGTTLLVKLPAKPLLLGLGLFVFVFAMRNLLDLHGEKRISRWWALPASLAGGTIGAVFGTSGPTYVIYLTHRLRDKGLLRATLSGVFVFEGSLRVVSFAMAGLLHHVQIWKAYGFALPIVLVALYGGNHLHAGLAESHALRLIGGLLLLSSVALMMKALS